MSSAVLTQAEYRYSARHGMLIQTAQPTARLPQRLASHVSAFGMITMRARRIISGTIIKSTISENSATIDRCRARDALLLAALDDAATT